MIDSTELLFTVDENNSPIAPRPRAEVHANGIWHRVPHIWIMNNRKELLCQQRSLKKDRSPGMWEPFFGGHLNPRRTELEGAADEVREEVGLLLKPQDLRLFKTVKTDHGVNKEFNSIFLVRWSGALTDLKLEEDEVEQVIWQSIREVNRLVLEDKHPDWHCIGYEPQLLPWLQKQE